MIGLALFWGVLSVLLLGVLSSVLLTIYDIVQDSKEWRERDREQ